MPFMFRVEYLTHSTKDGNRLVLVVFHLKVIESLELKRAELIDTDNVRIGNESRSGDDGESDFVHDVPLDVWC